MKSTWKSSASNLRSPVKFRPVAASIGRALTSVPALHSVKVSTRARAASSGSLEPPGDSATLKARSAIPPIIQSESLQGL